MIASIGVSRIVPVPVSAVYVFRSLEFLLNLPSLTPEAAKLADLLGCQLEMAYRNDPRTIELDLVKDPNDTTTAQ